MIRGQDQGGASPIPATGPRALLTGGPSHGKASVQEETGREPRQAEARASEHRHGGAKPPLQLASEGMGPLGGDEAHLFDGLTATAKGNCVALMAIGLDAIGIDMHHQSTDLAAGTGGDRHGRNGVGRSPSAPPPEWLQGLHSSPA